jgi:ArsR family transcriptional regulator, lead/cadmium/zinc/bismuth-responsive transcriptional repressor
MSGADLSLLMCGKAPPYICQPSSRIGENPPYGMIGRVEETTASFEARVRASTLPDCGGRAMKRASLPLQSQTASAESQCHPKPQLTARPLLSLPQAEGLERTFKVLANVTRLRLLHALAKRPGLAVTELAQMVAMKPQAVSNQLQRLVDKGILSNVRNGTNIHYRIVDPCTMSLLDQGLCLAEDRWERRSSMSLRPPRATR